MEDALNAVRERRFDLYVCDGDFPASSYKIKPVQDAFFTFYEQLILYHTQPNLILMTINDDNLVRARNMGIECFSKFDWVEFLKRLQLR
ncbi:MAG: hypothetical protein AABX54_05045 [Nanoarchaeota archaeon]